MDIKAITYKRRVVPLMACAFFALCCVAAFAVIAVCGKCGHERLDDAVVCGHCGASFPAATKYADPGGEEPKESAGAPVLANQPAVDHHLESAIISMELKLTEKYLAENMGALAELFCKNAMALNLLTLENAGTRSERILHLLKRSNASYASSAIREARAAMARSRKAYELLQKARRYVPVGNTWLPVHDEAKLSMKQRVLLRRAQAAPCGTCLGFGKVVCSKCKGTGRVECPNGCKKGWVQIEAMDGLNGKARMKEVRCPTCLGYSRVNCGECLGGGAIVCETCKGLGERAQCSECGGEGMSACRRCNGSGLYKEGKCTYCGGKGQILCRECKGDGKKVNK